jgi:aryl-alcohol dehydrogenase-like predicted oxidoreductase
MKTTTLGGTGLPVTPVGLGLAAVGRPAYINLGRARDLGPRRSVEDMEQRARSVLDVAYDAGVRYFDVARSYGRAERFLAAWLSARDIAPGQVTVGSKWGYTYVGAWHLNAAVHEVKDHSVDALRRQYEESRQLLGDHLRLYQIHSATIDTGVLADTSVTSELAALAETGLVLGLSLSGPQQSEALELALDIEVEGTNPFSCVQATFNLLEPSVGDGLNEAHEAGWGVIAKEVFANGRLVGPELDRRIEDRALLEHIAKSYDTTLDALALWWVLSHDFVDVALSGAVTPAQLKSNLSALDVPIDPEDRAVFDPLREPPATYWRTRTDLDWS